MKKSSKHKRHSYVYYTTYVYVFQEVTIPEEEEEVMRDEEIDGFKSSVSNASAEGGRSKTPCIADTGM